MNKKALGKGLAAFIPEEFGIIKEERFAELDIDQVSPNPAQPRTRFDDQSIEELARSIKESGIVQPIVVVPEDGGYKIIVGERRWRAAQRAGLRKIPVLVRNIAKEDQLEISLIENIHREDLNPMEVALTYSRLIEDHGYTQQELADKVGKDRTSVTNYMRLLKLPEEVREKIVDGTLSMGHARAVLALEEPAAQLQACREVLEKGLSVRDAEKLVNRLKERTPRKQKPLADPDLEALQEELVKRFGTKVMISGSRNKGVVKIFYFSLDDLNMVYGKVKGE